MAAKPAEPARTGNRAANDRVGAAERVHLTAPADGSDPRHADSSDPQDGEQARAHERIGPITIARHRKDDGRALILYTRDPQPPA
jgi:hypothetical protein